MPHPHSPPAARRPRLNLVELEDRRTPATFVVTTTQDNGDNTAPTPGSLREAILKANAAAGTDTITFAIPGAGVQTISPPTALPGITDPVVIDGTTQAGYSGTPVVQLSGTAATGSEVDGLDLLNHSGSQIKGLTIGGFQAAGVRISGGGQHLLVGDYIGVTQNGSAADGNLVGVLVTGNSTANTIGTNTTGLSGPGNVISGNRSDGIEVVTAAQTRIVGNYIGTDGSGQKAVPNGGAGVVLAGGTTGTQVGSPTPGDGNVISGNAGSGVRITDADTAGNTVYGNRIGLGFTGLALPNGGDGVLAQNGAGSNPAAGVSAATANAVQSNTISQNTGNGVAVRDTTRHLLIGGQSPNSIFTNGQLGIVVDPTANAGLAAPTITSVTVASVGGTTVTGTITGQPSTQYLVDLFTNSAPDPSGFGEGQTPAGSVTVTTDATGAGKFTGTTPASATGQYVTATVTAVATAETSAFSNSATFPVSPPPPPPPPPPPAARVFATGADAGGGPQVNVYKGDGTLAYTVQAFAPTFTGGVRVAMADVNGDGTPDLIVGTGPGVPTQVKVFDGTNQSLLTTLSPFEASFTGGVYVAAGDINADGKADVIVTPDQGGGPVVAIYSGAGFTAGTAGDSALVTRYFGIVDPNFRGGARAAVGDVNGDGVPDVAVSAGFLGGPRVSVWNGRTLTAGATPQTLFNDFFAFEQTLRNGVFLALGDVNGDGHADLIAGGGPGGGPRVTVFDGAALLTNQQVARANFFAGDPNNRGGVRLAARDVSGDGLADLVTGPGPGGGSTVSVYSGSALSGNSTPGTLLTEQPFPGFNGGVFVG